MCVCLFVVVWPVKVFVFCAFYPENRACMSLIGGPVILQISAAKMAHSCAPACGVLSSVLPSVGHDNGRLSTYEFPREQS